MIRDEIINDLRIETSGVKLSGFPLDAFPQEIQSIALDWKARDDYRPEYTCAAFLSAASTAIGNSHHLRIRGSWVNNPALFVFLIGRPGLGKTPPLKTIYGPILALDEARIAKFRTDMERYEQMQKDRGKAKSDGSDGTSDMPKPVLVQTVLEDFTPEAMINMHSTNPRGIALKIDEIMGMFNTVNRYSSGNLIEQLLSSFSGSPLKKTRVSELMPVYISNPCINIIGTLQSNRVHELFDKGYYDCGLLDRFIFVYPSDQSLSLWSLEEDIEPMTPPIQRWENILHRLHELPCETDDNGGYHPVVLEFSDGARRMFYQWRNSLAEQINATQNDNEIETRVMKSIQIAARMALVMQLLRWACGEAHKEFVDEVSTSAAIRLSEYFEDCYRRVMVAIGLDRTMDNRSRNERLLADLPDTFTTKDAIAIGARYQLKSDTVKHLLGRLVESGSLLRPRNGSYAKVLTNTSSITPTTDTLNSAEVSEMGEMSDMDNSTIDAQQ